MVLSVRSSVAAPLPRLVARLKPEPTPHVPNGSKIDKFQNEGFRSRPRRSSPQPPGRLTVERRCQTVPDALMLPESGFSAVSSHAPAFMPPPRPSSVRKPRREFANPSVLSCTAFELALETERKLMSTTPNTV